MSLNNTEETDIDSESNKDADDCINEEVLPATFRLDTSSAKRHRVWHYFELLD